MLWIVGKIDKEGFVVGSFIVNDETLGTHNREDVILWVADRYADADGVKFLAEPLNFDGSPIVDLTEELSTMGLFEEDREEVRRIRQADSQ